MSDLSLKLADWTPDPAVEPKRAAMWGDMVEVVRQHESLLQYAGPPHDTVALQMLRKQVGL